MKRGPKGESKSGLQGQRGRNNNMMTVARQGERFGDLNFGPLMSGFWMKRLSEVNKIEQVNSFTRSDFCVRVKLMNA